MNTRRTAEQAFQKALTQKRQPDCPHCGKPLVVELIHTRVACWFWNNARQRYEADEADGGVEMPTCTNCGVADPDFIRLSSAVPDLCERLGLEY
jgi:hypothetical protein